MSFFIQGSAEIYLFISFFMLLSSFFSITMASLFKFSFPNILSLKSCPEVFLVNAAAASLCSFSSFSLSSSSYCVRIEYESKSSLSGLNSFLMNVS